MFRPEFMSRKYQQYSPKRSATLCKLHGFEHTSETCRQSGYW